MALWVCRGCTTSYAVGAPRCPQCGSTDHAEEGQETMPKITVHGGPSNADVTPAPGSPDTTAVEPSDSPDAGTDTGPELSGDAGPELASLPEASTVLPTQQTQEAPVGTEPSGEGTGVDLPTHNPEAGEQSSPGTSSQTSQPKPAPTETPNPA